MPGSGPRTHKIFVDTCSQPLVGLKLTGLGPTGLMIPNPNAVIKLLGVRGDNNFDCQASSDQEMEKLQDATR